MEDLATKWTTPNLFGLPFSLLLSLSVSLLLCLWVSLFLSYQSVSEWSNARCSYYRCLIGSCFNYTRSTCLPRKTNHANYVFITRTTGSATRRALATGYPWRRAGLKEPAQTTANLGGENRGGTLKLKGTGKWRWRSLRRAVSCYVATEGRKESEVLNGRAFSSVMASHRQLPINGFR